MIKWGIKINRSHWHNSEEDDDDEDDNDSITVQSKSNTNPAPGLDLCPIYNEEVAERFSATLALRNRRVYYQRIKCDPF